MAHHKRYAIGILIGACLLIALASAFNALVDPYAVFGAPRIAGFNDAKPYAGDRGRTGKLHQVLRANPKGLIVGNSRPEMGLSPDHACWPEAARPVYNLGLPGLTVYSQVRYAQHAQADGPVAILVIGVDLVDFISPKRRAEDPRAWPPVGIDPDSEPFAVDSEGRPVRNFDLARIADYVDAALSLDALGHSLITVARQSGHAVPTRTPDGFNPAETFYQPIIRAEGQGVLFQQMNRAMVERLGRADWHLFAKDEDWSFSFESLQRLLRQSREAGTETVVFINPYHAEYLLLLEAGGLWPQFESWKRHLVDLVRAEGAALWDFSGFDGYANEPVAGLPSSASSLAWFWEPAHYRRELGDIMLANIWREHCPPDHADAPAFGSRLDAFEESGSELDVFLAARRAERDAFKISQPDVVARIEALVGR